VVYPSKKLPQKREYMQDQIQNDADTIVDSIGAAQFLGMSGFFITKHSSGKQPPLIPYFKIGNRLRFKMSSLRAFLAARQSSKKV
jgi:hypothetical protein